MCQAHHRYYFQILIKSEVGINIPILWIMKLRLGIIAQDHIARQGEDIGPKTWVSLMLTHRPFLYTSLASLLLAILISF